MKRLLQQRYIVRQNLLLLIGFCLAFYFCYHLVAGPRSYLRLMAVEHQVSKIEREYREVSAERQALERKVVMMRPGTIDRDLLEEQARKTLGYRLPGEKIVIIN